jgi:hypothetical protein
MDEIATYQIKSRFRVSAAGKPQSSSDQVFRNTEEVTKSESDIL